MKVSGGLNERHYGTSSRLKINSEDQLQKFGDEPRFLIVASCLMGLICCPTLSDPFSNADERHPLIPRLPIITILDQSDFQSTDRMRKRYLLVVIPLWEEA